MWILPSILIVAASLLRADVFVSGTTNGNTTGDVASDTTSTCDPDMTDSIGNGWCQYELNVEACGFDGGDCCECDCNSLEDEVSFVCGSTPYSCVDPSSACVDACATELTACLDDTDCATCESWAVGDNDDGACGISSNGTCSDWRDYFCCKLDGGGVDDFCSDNALLLDYLSCDVQQGNNTDCVFTEFCDDDSQESAETSSSGSAETSSSGSGCAETEFCGQDTTCEACWDSLWDILSDGDDDETTIECADAHEVFCPEGVDVSCYSNVKFVAEIECIAEAAYGCEIDGTCFSGAKGFFPSRATLFFSAALAGILVAALGSVP